MRALRMLRRWTFRGDGRPRRATPVAAAVLAAASLLVACDYVTLPIPEAPPAASLVVAGPVPLVTDDRGGTATFTIALGVKPLADVQLSLSTSDASIASVEPALLSFSPLNWDVPQQVTVSGMLDAVRTGDRSYTIVFAPAISADARYSGFVAPALAALAVDGEVAGVIVTPAEIVTTEARRPATLSVRLRSAPVADVTVSVASSDPGEGTVQPSLLVFTPDDWSVPKDVTVTGADDLVADGDQGYQIAFGPTSSSDPGYDAVPCDPVTATNLDDEGVGFVVTPTEGLVTTEAGGTATFTIALLSAPTADVTLTLSTTDAGEGAVTSATVVLTPGDWDAPHLVTVRGVDDGGGDGSQPYDVVAAPAASDDLRYAGLVAPAVHATNLDDDTPGIRVTPTEGLVTTEAGGTATFEIVLESRPTADVTVSVFVPTDYVGEGAVAPAEITFTPETWSVPVTVTVTGVDDGVVDGPKPYLVVTVPAISDDPRYAGLDAPNVSVTNLDND